jgi:pimeloyl-ACP methyl ester carboxylesterase/nucleoside-diphosphate-sugar epimerase
MTIDAFVTGGTGLLGRFLVLALTARGRRTGVLVRNAGERARELHDWLEARGADTKLVTVVDGDLSRAELGLARDDARNLGRVRDVFHAGGAMRFGMSRDEAFDANVEGTKRVIDVARRSDALERVVVVGGFRLGHGAPGARHGVYEASKIEAERVAIEAAERFGFRLSRVQPGSIVGDSRSGETTQLFGFGELVRDLWLGKIPALPGGARHWMPIVPVDWLAAFIAGLPSIDRELADGEHVVLDDHTPSLEELLERLARHLGVRAPRRHVPKGALQLFLRMGGERLTGAAAEGLDFLEADRYDVARTRRAARAMDVGELDAMTAALRTTDYLVATRFDPRPRKSAPGEGRGRMERVAGEPTFVRGDMRAPIALLHGLPLDADAWDALGRALDVDAIRPDLPGLGRSVGEGTRPLDFMRSLLSDGEPRAVVAHSLGTRYAVEYAAVHPDRVRALVLVSPYFAQRPPPAPLRSRTLAPLALSLAPVAKVLPPRGLDDAYRAGLTRTLARGGAKARIGRALAVAHAERAAAMTMLERACAAGVRVLVIVGSDDPLVEKLPDAVEVRVIEGTGHFPQLDAPDVVAEHVRSFLPAPRGLVTAKPRSRASRYAHGEAKVANISLDAVGNEFCTCPPHP